MKNNYRKLKLSILLQTVFVTALTVLVGGFLLRYVVDGVYNDFFANGFTKILMTFQVEEEVAINWYWKLIAHNKTFFMVLGFLSLFALFFYVALSKMTKYLEQVEKGIENIVSDSNKPVRLITELKPIEERLNEIKSTLKRQELRAIEGEKKKNDLVVFLAHDLKTPLTSVVAYLSMIESHPEMPMEERAKYTHISLQKAIRLGELINEFFEITRLNLQDIVLDVKELDLSMMLAQLSDEVYGVLRDKQLSCELVADENLRISGDADKLARVFDNLLRNAIAYCTKGSAIQIIAEEVDNYVQITVINEGEYIPKDKLQAIFDKFYRGDDSRSSRTGGAGLGLAISKQIIELHHGKIYAECEAHIIRFIVKLPKKAEGESNAVSTDSRRPPWSKSRGRKIAERTSQKRDLG